MGINGNHERSYNGSGIKCLHQSQVTFTQEIWVGEEVNTEHLWGAKFLAPDSINGVNKEQAGIMGMEITGFGIAASQALNSTLINVPINYEKQQTHAGQSICVQ